MPDFHEIGNEIAGEINKRMSVVLPYDFVRKSYVAKLHELTKRNVILYYSAWQQKQHVKNLPHAENLSIEDYDMNGFMSVVHGLDRHKGLDLILHTPGGDLAATEAIGSYLKKHFSNDIRVIVPHLAMSGGTLLAFAARQIVMGIHSSLGPIDPIINGLPAHGICEEFSEALESVMKTPATIEVWKHIIAKYPPSFIGDCRKAIQWSDDIATRWLADGMFADITDEAQRNERVEKIVRSFGDHETTKSHSRHYMADQCIDLGLKILQLEEDDELQDAVLSVHHACNYMLGLPNVVKMIENHVGKTHAIVMQPN